MNLVVRAYGHAACSGTPVQEWIDAIYPEEEKDQIIELLISDEQLKKLKGPLELKWFTNLRSFDCSNKQSHNYGEITSLEIIGCPNLKEIFCRENRITRLDVTNCPNLKVLHCSGNLLSELDLKQNKLLEKLVICNNDFTRSDLSFLNHLINLKELQLGNWNEKDVQRGSYNHFHGSLESLKNLTNLKLIDISIFFALLSDLKSFEQQISSTLSGRNSSPLSISVLEISINFKLVKFFKLSKLPWKWL
jgi:hypothetical protein